MANDRPLLSRRLSRCLLVLASVLAMAPAFSAEPPRYALDPVHTRVLVSVSHAGFSRAMGTVSGSTGELRFDPVDWSTAALDVKVPLGKLDFGDAKWNRAVLARNLLDAAAHPVARFVSSKVTPRDATHACVCGTLTLRGVSRPLCLNVALNQLRRHPLPPFRRTAGFSATATLERSAFGITAWKNVIGDEVKLRIEAEAVATRGSETADSSAPSETPAPADVPGPTDAPEPAEAEAEPGANGPDEAASETPTGA